MIQFYLRALVAVFVHGSVIVRRYRMRLCQFTQCVELVGRGECVEG